MTLTLTYPAYLAFLPPPPANAAAWFALLLRVYRRPLYVPAYVPPLTPNASLGDGDNVVTRRMTWRGRDAACVRRVSPYIPRYVTRLATGGALTWAAWPVDAFDTADVRMIYMAAAREPAARAMSSTLPSTAPRLHTTNATAAQPWTFCEPTTTLATLPAVRATHCMQHNIYCFLLYSTCLPPKPSYLAGS